MLKITDSALKECREHLTVRVASPHSFCVRARCSLDRYEAVARSEVKPSLLLYSAARLDASSAALQVKAYLDRCASRVAMLTEHLPPEFTLPYMELRHFPALTAWELPRLTVHLDKATQDDIARLAGVTRQYVYAAEKGRCNFAPRLAIAYLSYVSTEQRYAANVYAAIESAWASLAMAAPPGWVPDPDGAGCGAESPAPVPQHA